jgi:mRNA interferase RelE/StbE
MHYTLLYAPRAERDLKKIPVDLRIRILKRLEELQIDPYSHVKKLHDISLYSLRVGKYRIILDIQHTRCIILVLTAGHRANIYDRI